MGKVMCRPDSRPGTYVLVLVLDKSCVVQAGRLGELQLEAGWYAYVGSAFGPGGIQARCGHHRQISQRPHWHIDYLRAVARLDAIWFSHDLQRREHQWAQLLSSARGARIPVPGFGSSDCNCLSHLVYLSRPPSFESFRRRVRREIPDSVTIFNELVKNALI